MPTVVNGIGTWYYGKRRIHSRKGTCEFCGSLTTLESYDTTLFFVVFFVPLIPLGRKRILEKCAVCERHRVLSLKKWEEAKVSQGAVILDQLRREPNNRDFIVQAIAFTQAYQDEPLLQEVIVPLVRDRTDDAAIQAQLADAYAYFARWPEAEQAYRASLAIQENETVRERLGWTLLKQGRPQEARPLLQHILDKKITDAAGTIYFLVQGYQAEGLHDEALALMDDRDAAFPEFAKLKEYQKQRKSSTRYRGTQKKVRSTFLEERGKAVFIGALAAYLGSAVWIGQARKVFLVNGTSRPYTVSIGGREHTLPAGAATPVRIAEGDVEVVFSDAKLGLEPVRCRIESSFWGRPFANRTFVINPDHAAVVVEEETWYADAAPPPGEPPHFHIGHASYAFSGLDYEFKEFPPTLQVRSKQAVKKTRVALEPMGPEARLNLIQQQLTGQEQVDFCKRLLRLDPGNSVFLAWLTNKLPPDQALDFFKVHLDDRPLLVDWHRMYQSLMEKARPETDLRPRYQQIVAETKGHPDAVYLLGRIEPDRDKANQLFRQAAAGKPPSAHAMNALGYEAISQGQFADAVAWYEKALALVPDQTMIGHLYHDALLANRDYDRLLTELKGQGQASDNSILALMAISRVYAIRGDKEKARETLAQAVKLNPPGQRQLFENAFEAGLAAWEGDADGFLKRATEKIGLPSFELAFLRGNLEEAATLIKPADPEAHVRHALLYLAATRSGDKKLALTHRQALEAKLAKGSREERLLADLLAGRKTLAQHPPERIVLDPREKRVFLAVLAERYPAQAKEMIALAKRLDFHRDAISLCLRKVLDEKGR